MAWRAFVMLLGIGAVVARAQAPVPGVPNWHEVSPDITRGGRPSADAVRELARRGVHTVLNLEDDESAVSDEKSLVESLGMRFVSTPLSPFSYPAKSTVDAALAELRAPSDYPVFVHCEHGRDRTGLVVGLHRVFDEKWEPRAAHDEMLRLGFRTFLFGLDNYFRDQTHFDGEIAQAGP